MTTLEFIQSIPRGHSRIWSGIRQTIYICATRHGLRVSVAKLPSGRYRVWRV